MIALLLGTGVVGGVAALTTRLQRRRAATEVARVDALIAAKGLRTRFEGHDDSLRLRAGQRRDAADRLKRQAASLESGAQPQVILRRVK